jgi:putative aldouronate transport system substrate-binding protein
MYLDYVDFNNLEFNWDFVTQQTMPRQIEIAKEVNNYAGPAFSTPAGLSDNFDKNAPSIKTTREQIAAKIVLGNVTMDEGYAQYNQFWQSIGGDAILNELNDKLVK